MNAKIEELKQQRHELLRKAEELSALITAITGSHLYSSAVSKAIDTIDKMILEEALK